MKRMVVAACGAVAFAAWSAGGQAQQIVKHEPPLGQMRHGEIVLVDNGRCPKGQVQEVTGGSGGPSRNHGRNRTRRCVPRP